MSDLKSDLQNFIKANPKWVLKQQIGKAINYPCPKCGYEWIKIDENGDGICQNPECNVKIEINFAFDEE